MLIFSLNRSECNRFQPPGGASGDISHFHDKGTDDDLFAVFADGTGHDFGPQNEPGSLQSSSFGNGGLIEIGIVFQITGIGDEIGHADAFQNGAGFSTHHYWTCCRSQAV